MAAKKQQREYCGAIINQNVPQKNNEIYCIRLFARQKPEKNQQASAERTKSAEKSVKKMLDGKYRSTEVSDTNMFIIHILYFRTACQSHISEIPFSLVGFAALFLVT